MDWRSTWYRALGRWLRGALELLANGSVVRFSVDPPGDWDATRTARARLHFELLTLGDLYTTYAAEELVNIAYQLQVLHDSGGSEGVHQHLLGLAESRKNAARNSWQTATYEALAESEEYCGGAFANVI